ncbi:hypothetical protein [Salinibacterium sp. ZJ454]|uniref:hypothetical protein n=1 Tax=Salinibacterium sp. ZJ454 TaxID=2708339 RepID=UPI0014245B27|nr:hypothetical protein [Salinibacterium sp. ZJ454]
MTLADDDIRAVVARLRESLGEELVADLGSVDAATVAAWAAGTGSPDAEAGVRLRIAGEVVGVLGPSTSSSLREWMTASNPLLGDRSPTEVLREANVTVARSTVLAAARSSAAN